MPYGVKLRVFGDFACFTRPESKVERISYDIITPSASRAVLEAIYWKPGIRWIIDKIHVRKVMKVVNGENYIINDGIKFMNIRRNELKDRLPRPNSKMMKGEEKAPVLFVDEMKNRQQKAALILRDVEYIIEAHFEETGVEELNEAKHIDIFKRRAQKGQCFKQPYLGCREFSCNFELLDDFDISGNIEQSRDLGIMLFDIDFANDYSAMFFRAKMTNGTVVIPHPKSEGVLL